MTKVVYVKDIPDGVIMYMKSGVLIIGTGKEVRSAATERTL
ncbi:MAG TPA: hypothetical protein VNM69_17945 [Bacillus sp. (in: firmicutes)]|nr:hypothetical protein [Bacillus sp. (in: firmicutes)]